MKLTKHLVRKGTTSIQVRLALRRLNQQLELNRCRGRSSSMETETTWGMVVTEEAG
jgi:hypothetical protein